MPELLWVETDRCRALRRNPQFLAPHTMEALKTSIERDGFLAPVLLRPAGEDFEVLSGNHRVMAARELGMSRVPAIVVSGLSEQAARRVAVNLNTVHGDPTAELLAPFLAEFDVEALASVHLSEDMLAEVKVLDEHLAERLGAMAVPDGWDNPSPQSEQGQCVCPTCGKHHIRKTAPATVDG